MGIQALCRGYGTHALKRLLWTGVLVVLCASCSGDGVGLTESGDLPPMDSGDGVSFRAEVQPIFNANCTRCHRQGGVGFDATGGDAANGLDLTAANAYSRLVDQPTFEEPATPPRWRVLPSQPDSSYIVQKLRDDVPKFGRRMPWDGPPYLSDAQIETIRTWIAEGARNN